ncbi:MAG: hypothetical protein AAB676_07250, partial [Verrucomicrobiota bacterium]
RGGNLSWSNAFSNGVCTVETADTLAGPWNPVQNVFTSNSVATVQIGLSNRSGFYRLAAADISGTPEGFNNLAASWSTLTTIAGKGEVRRDGLNNWQPQFEGGLAIEAELSRPHFAMSDAAGNVYIADKDAHAIRKVTPEGRLFTVAGTNIAGDDGNSPGPATQRRLSSPNGLWVRADGTFYVLDTGNEKIRRVDANGQMTTLFSTGSFVPDRGLWVSDDETEAYFSAITSVVKWTPAAGRQVVAGGFVELGNLIVNPAGQLVVTDRGGHTVYLVQADGAVSPIAGNGDVFGGGDGSPALETGLAGVRGVWPLPNGGYLLATHKGSQIWYLDTAGIIHLFVDGTGGAHSGDGEYFRTPGFKISEVRSVALDYQGNILITESDYGFVRKIEFLRYVP